MRHYPVQNLILFMCAHVHVLLFLYRFVLSEPTGSILKVGRRPSTKQLAVVNTSDQVDETAVQPSRQTIEHTSDQVPETAVQQTVEQSSAVSEGGRSQLSGEQWKVAQSSSLLMTWALLIWTWTPVPAAMVAAAAVVATSLSQVSVWISISVVLSRTTLWAWLLHV